MSQAVRVSATLAGRHSLGSGDAKRACAKIEDTLSGCPAVYSVRSDIPGHELSTKGGMGGSESFYVSIDRSSFSVSWEAESTFSVPAPMLAVADGCLGIAGDVRVRASAVFTQIPIEPPVIANGTLVRRLALVMVDLDLPDPAQKAPDTGEFKFTGIAMQSDAGMGDLVVSGSTESPAPGTERALEYMLLTLSGYHKVYHK